MKVTINYEINYNGDIDASIRLPTGEYACAGGKTKAEARNKVIERAKQKLTIIEPEDVEI